MKRPLFVFLALLAIIGGGSVSASPVGASALTRPADTESAARAAGTLDLRAALRMESVRVACPPGASSSTLCSARTGSGIVSGLGRVTEAYTYMVEFSSPSCPPGSVKVLGYPARFTVAGKGELHLSVAEHRDCLPENAGPTATQPFAITGGTGAYAGASGSGTVTRVGGETATGGGGTDTWIGTLNVPGLEFDVTPPMLRGAKSRTVRAPKRAKRVRVRYGVTATDAVDGRVAVSCRPRSGSRFKLGRTLVRCSATDTSGNTASRAFRITVRARR